MNLEKYRGKGENIEVTGKISQHELTHSLFKNSKSHNNYLMRKPNKI
jgi:hypothetical protein